MQWPLVAAQPLTTWLLLGPSPCLFATHHDLMLLIFDEREAALGLSKPSLILRAIGARHHCLKGYFHGFHPPQFSLPSLTRDLLTYTLHGLWTPIPVLCPLVGPKHWRCPPGHEIILVPPPLLGTSPSLKYSVLLGGSRSPFVWASGLSLQRPTLVPHSAPEQALTVCLFIPGPLSF